MRGVDLLANVIADLRNNNNDNYDNKISTQSDLSRLLDLDFDDALESSAHRDASKHAEDVENLTTAEASEAPTEDVVAANDSAHSPSALPNGNTGLDDTFRHCVSAFRLIRDFVKDLIEETTRNRAKLSPSTGKAPWDNC